MRQLIPRPAVYDVAVAILTRARSASATTTPGSVAQLLVVSWSKVLAATQPELVAFRPAAAEAAKPTVTWTDVLEPAARVVLRVRVSTLEPSGVPAVQPVPLIDLKVAPAGSWSVM